MVRYITGILPPPPVNGFGPVKLLHKSVNMYLECDLWNYIRSASRFSVNHFCQNHDVVFAIGAAGSIDLLLLRRWDVTYETRKSSIISDYWFANFAPFRYILVGQPQNWTIGIPTASRCLSGRRTIPTQLRWSFWFSQRHERTVGTAFCWDNGFCCNTFLRNK